MDEAGGQEIIVESWSPTCAVLAEFQTEFQTEIHADDTAAIVLRRVADSGEPAIAQTAEVRQTVTATRWCGCEQG
jgi:hypothetical protein